jgi:predicted Zn-dependent peptidase|tara:strand:- start:19639 stop:20832 length:1194 start_codon:yes stop_codon:yes gene_type:complete
MIHNINKTHSKLSTLVIGFDAGSRVESVGEYNDGIAHMLEHCIFKGTNRRDWHKIQKDIGFLGGDINAFTSHEMVAYHITVPYENIEEAMDIMSDMVMNSQVPEEEFLREKQVVIEEEISRSDDVHSYMWNNFSNKFFDNYLSNPVIGTQDSINSFTSEEVKRFYKQFCGIENAVISLCSNQTRKRSKELLKSYFGKPTGKISNNSAFSQSLYSDANDMNITKPGIEHTYVWVGYPSIPIGHELSSASNLMMTILGSGMDSRLFSEVREKRGLAYGIDSSNNQWNYGSLAMISSSTREHNLDEMLSVIGSEVDLIRSKAVDEEELQRAKNKMKSVFYHLIEDSYGVAMRSVRQKLWSLKTLDQLVEDINKVSIEDVMKAANIIFDESKKTTLVCRGE